MSRYRVTTACVLLVAWLVITFLAAPPAGPEGGFGDLVTRAVGRQFVIASLFITAAALLLRWPEIGLGWPRPRRSLRLLWLPGLYLLLFAALAVWIGLPPAQVTAFVLVNTLLVGLSEEMMFRGVFLGALRSAMPVWPAIFVSTVVFGAVHVLNVAYTGDFGGAVIQAVAAMMSGTLFAAIRLRTGSVWPAVLVHGLWDFGVFLVTVGAQAHTPPGAAAPGFAAQATFLLFVVPAFLYALFLLRKIGRTEAAATKRPLQAVSDMHI